jgi:glycosyltransferase involved in cell wall biosynthesis
VRKIIREEPGVETIHQVTFASALLPNVLPRSGKIRAVWGPVNLRSGVVRPEGRRAPVIGLIALKMAPIFARWNARKVDLIIAANESTLRRFRRTKVTLEPPIFLDPMRLHETPSDPRRLVYCGKLTDLKRPWVAIDAMTDDRLAGYSLILLGEGPLGGAMKQRAIDAGIADRVIFAGQIERAVALEMIARSRALLHPSTTEGAAWAVGEAAALGVPSVVFENTGADTTVKLSDNGGIAVRSTGDLVGDFTAGIVQVLKGPRPAPVPRWDKTRISNLLDSWWAVE